MDAAVMIPRFEIVKDSSIAYSLSPSAMSFANTAPTFNGQLEFGHESIGEG